MREGPDISHLAAMIGDPARANILTALMGGQALTATELAAEAGVSLPTASQHIAKLVDTGFLSARKQGRHKYLKIASGEVADVLEALMGLAETRGLRRVRPGPKDADMRQARVCYNHLAGARGVQLYDSLVGRGFLALQGEGIELSDTGRDFAREFGVDLAPLDAARAPLCRTCLDWSERRNHLAGSFGRAILARILEQGWARRDAQSRTIAFGKTGARAFDRAFPT